MSSYLLLCVDSYLVEVRELVKVISTGDFRSLSKNLMDVLRFIVELLLPIARDPRFRTYLEDHWNLLDRSYIAVSLQADALITGEEIHSEMLNVLHEADAADDPTWLQDCLSLMLTELRREDATGGPTTSSTNRFCY